MDESQKQAVVNLLWDYLKRDPEHNDRRQTAWGTKTRFGLAACVTAIVEEHYMCEVPHGN